MELMHTAAVICLLCAYTLFSPLSDGALAEGYDIIVVAGQSNAAERGEGAFTARFESEDSRIRQIGRFGADAMQVVPVGRLHDGVIWSGLQDWDDHPKRYYMGFSLPFTRLYARYRLAVRRTALIIPTARGGTSIRSWLGEDGQPFPELYPDMLARVRHAISPSLPGTNRIVAFLWHQGEKDLLNGMTPENYRAKRIEFFARLRSDLRGKYPILTTKFTEAWRASDPVKLGFERAIMAATMEDGRGKVVPRTGLLSNGEVLGTSDVIHFSAQANQLLGVRFFRAWEAHATSTAIIDR
jgi:hypothetical protein